MNGYHERLKQKNPQEFKTMTFSLHQY